VKEEGDVCRHGGKTGDLYVVLFVPSQHKERKRNGINIESEIKITRAQARAGCEIVVNTTKGVKTTLVSPGTKNGDCLVLRGYGVCQLGVPGKNGDHIIKLVCE
jgi:DnaJ-class molecular chaperone